MESSSQSQSSSSSSSFLRYLNIIRTGFLQLQLSLSSWVQSKTKSFSTTRRIASINTHPPTQSSYYSLPSDEELLWEKSCHEAVVEKSRDNLRLEVSKMRDEFGVVPGLATIPVGNTIKESQTYLTLKKTCKIVGIKFYENPLPDDSTPEQILDCANRFRHDPRVHCTFIPYPFPHHMDEEKILDALCLPLDPSGFPQPIQPWNMQVKDPTSGDSMKRCIELSKKYDKVDMRGKRVVVIGLRNIFANTDWQFLEREGASIINIRVSEINNCKDIIKEADIFMVALKQLAKEHRLLSVKKPKAVVYDIDPMPGQTKVHHLLSRTIACATRELHSKSKK